MVIAIIGILASVVLASLNDARTSARKTAVIQQVGELAKLFELNSLSTPGGAYASGSGGVWILSEGGSPTCDTVNLTGLTTENQTKFRAICNSIKKSVDPYYYLMLIGWGNNTSYGGNYYTVQVIFDSTWQTIICAGSRGGRYVGPSNPGTGDYTGSGCYYNP